MEGRPIPTARSSHFEGDSRLFGSLPDGANRKHVHRLSRKEANGMARRRVGTVLRTVMIGVLATMVLAVGEDRAAAAEYQSCKDVKLYWPNGSPSNWTEGLRKSQTSCKIARSVARNWLNEATGRDYNPRRHGYSCSEGRFGVVCRKGERRVKWEYAQFDDV